MAQTLRIFISSPGDVAQERMLAARVLERLQGEFAGYFRLRPVFGAPEPVSPAMDLTEECVLPSETDIAVFILWSRMGGSVPDGAKKEDGTDHRWGTEWEFENAERAFREKGAPDVLMYRKIKKPEFNLLDAEEKHARREQKKQLDNFINHWFGNPREGFKVAFHVFESPDEFEEQLEIHLHKLIRQRLPEYVTADSGEVIPAGRVQGRPYRGLQPFNVEHAPVFFGRTKAIGGIKDALIRQAALDRVFVLVFGMSGCGKSSLVRAGVLPAITRPGVIEGVDLWRWCVFRPGDAAGDLFEGLARAVCRQALPEQGVDGADVGRLAGLFRDMPEQAVLFVRQGLQRAGENFAAQEARLTTPVARMALVIDQMEELFTLERVGCSERESFIAAVSALARSGDVWVIATMRSEYYPRCAEIPELLRMKEGAGQYDLLPPDFTEIGQMIRHPARAAGLLFEKDPATGERLDDVLHEAAARDSSALPLLEFTLDELFMRQAEDKILTFAAYRELGGIEGALARRAEEVYGSLAPAVQATLPAVLRALVAPGHGSKYSLVSRRVPVDSLAVTEENKALLDAFTGARLLVTDRAGDSRAVVGVAHEALLRHWPRARQWLDEDREFLQTRERVAGAAYHWRQEGRLSDLLLARGKPLSEALDMVARWRGDLTAEVIEYVEASARKETGIRKKKNALLATIFTLILGFWIYNSHLYHMAGASIIRANKACEDAGAATDLANSEKERADTATGEANNAKILAGIKTEFARLARRIADEKTALAEAAARIAGKQKEELENQKSHADAQAVTAREATGAAYKMKAIAERQAELALQAIIKGTAEIPEKLRNIPETAPVLSKVLAVYIDLLDPILLEMKPGTPAGTIEARINKAVTESYEKALDIADDLSVDKNNTEAMWKQVVALQRIAYALAYQGDMPGALERSGKSLEILAELATVVDNNEENLKLIEGYIGSHAMFQLFNRDPEGAIDTSSRGLEVNSKDAISRRTLAHGYLFNNQFEKAENIYLENLDWSDDFLNDFKRFRELGVTCPDMEKIEQLLMVKRYYNEGDNLQKARDYQGAIQAYEKSRKVALELIGNGNNIEIQQQLVDVYSSLGKIRWMIGDLPGSLQDYENMKDIAIELAGKINDNEDKYYQANSYAGIGLALRDLGNMQAAREAYDQCLSIITELAADKNNMGAQKDLAGAYMVYAKLELFDLRPKEAVAAAMKALESEPELIRAKIMLAHGYLFDNRFDKAKLIYMENKDSEVVVNGENKYFADAVLEEFDEFRKKGITHPDMEKIETLLQQFG